MISATCVLAAVRSAMAGMPMDETAAAFTAGRWLLWHNGNAAKTGELVFSARP